MSNNRPQPPAQDQDPTRYRSADLLVRSILDDRPPTANISPSGELIRAIERFHRNVDRVRRGINASQAALENNSMSSGSDRELRRRFNRDPQPANASRDPLERVDEVLQRARRAAELNNVGPPPSLPPLRSLVGSRARANMASSGGGGQASRASRYRPSARSGDRSADGRRAALLEYRRARIGQEGLPSNLEDIDRNLETANSHLQALLDITNNPITTQSRMPTSVQTQDQAEETRRVKRRKLDSDRVLPSFKGFRYGKYGQVEPGQLKMEIVSCDGGLYSDELSYAAENILKNDATVYCTKGNRCNIVLRHQGATVFSLKELVIKAPGSDYSSPVREGMVFISMNQDELLTRTAQYQIPYVRSMPVTQGILSIRHEPDGRHRMHHRRMEEEDVPRAAQVPPEFSISPPPFHVTTECTDDDSDGDTGQSGLAQIYERSRRRTPNRIGALPFESESSDDGGDTRGPSVSDWLTFDEISGYSQARGEPGSGMTLEEAQEASQIATQEAVRAVGGELMAPLARFYIEKNKNKCTIRFDPPVSGRFILLKMWSPRHDSTKNIDIQGVIAKGFAGPRLVPSLDLR
ncbi:hypothetical protein QBC37DRAFT_413775 [Rhypophila decipiens]|uniref:Uncharacterized protein n=1 Tax=Rhypophila decipiens TaxID=261697 RepID=A0AAN6YEV4_9PEZI|nr:hypothetical protein QBC37DRAFT_413775 [Rhypophila decipiens]